jgi:hypothetical protein
MATNPNNAGEFIPAGPADGVAIDRAIGVALARDAIGPQWKGNVSSLDIQRWVPA